MGHSLLFVLVVSFNVAALPASSVKVFCRCFASRTSWMCKVGKRCCARSIRFDVGCAHCSRGNAEARHRVILWVFWLVCAASRDTLTGKRVSRFAPLLRAGLTTFRMNGTQA